MYLDERVVGKTDCVLQRRWDELKQLGERDALKRDNMSLVRVSSKRRAAFALLAIHVTT